MLSFFIFEVFNSQVPVSSSSLGLIFLCLSKSKSLDPHSKCCGKSDPSPRFPRIPKDFSSVQSLSRVRLFVTPWTAAHQASLSITNPPVPAQTQVHRVGDAIQPSHPLSSPSPPAFTLSHHQGLFQWVSSSHQVARGLPRKTGLWWRVRHSVNFLTVNCALTVGGFYEMLVE